MMTSVRSVAAAGLLAGLLVFSGCSSSSGNGSDGGLQLPDELPFVLTRTDVGQPLSADEISSFTKKITGFWKKIDYFGWAYWHSHGLDASYDPSMPDYKLWWQDTKAVKAGDTITFVHYGGADNLELRTAKVLAQAISVYLASGDPLIGKLVEQYCKGLVALFQGMEWGENDPDPYITARAIFTHNHSYTDEWGRKVAVDYDPVKVEKYDWNAHTVPNDDNPYFGKIWVRNLRSKDDLPHMFRTTPLLLRVVRDAQDESIRAAAQQAYDYMKGFAKDIVDHGYLIRSKEDGAAFVPMEEENPDMVKDLASFVDYDAIIPNAECDPKLTTALLAYGDAQGNDCGNGISTDYETIATGVHYFNYDIVRYFHLSAIVNALVTGQHRLAKDLLKGLIERCDTMTADQTERIDHLEWDADMAAFLLAAAASGLPLTSAEARIIQQRYSMSADFYQDWPYWDMYDASVPDGEYDYKPSRDAPDTKHVRLDALAFLMQYCYSPWRNPAGAKVVDCDIVLDPSRWGE